MVVYEDKHPWHNTSCHACGGPKDDKVIRERMGCDKPTKRPHRLMIGDEVEEIYTCPRQYMRPAIPYLRASRWAKAQNLAHMYPAGTLPAKVAEAIDLIDSEQATRMRLERED